MLIIDRLLITQWFRDVGDGPEFNHISNGYHPSHEEPAYVTERQRREWRGSIWAPRPAWLVNGEVRQL